MKLPLFSIGIGLRSFLFMISSVTLCNGLPCFAIDLQRDAHLIYGEMLLILRVKIIDEIDSPKE